MLTDTFNYKHIFSIETIIEDVMIRTGQMRVAKKRSKMSTSELNAYLDWIGLDWIDDDG